MPDDIKTKLDIFLASNNIAETLDEEILNKIGSKVVEDYEKDETSREEWKERNIEIIKLANQTLEQKNEPFDNAANIKYPLLSIAAIQFSARAYPAIVKGRNIVKGKVTGKDEGGQKAARSQRISTHMNYQLLEEMEEWEDQMDRLLTVLPIEGCEFKKTYFDPALGRNVSELVRPDDLVVNYKAKSLEPRATHKLFLTKNEYVERVRAGMYLDIENLDIPAASENEPNPDEDTPHLFLEQHRYWDLDDDDYKEPYICTVHNDTKKVVRVLARYDSDGIKINRKGKIYRIGPVQYFTKYAMIPAFDGGFYEMGFGSLASPINKTINTTINQMLDAGTIDNYGGGFLGKGVSLVKGGGGGVVKFKLNEWIHINYSGDDIRKSVLPRPRIEPSQVLFMLLGMMTEAGERLVSVTESLAGENPPKGTPATTTINLIKQGLKVFSAVYKRTHRSLKSEFKKLYRLNRIFLDDIAYFTVLDQTKAIAKKDYEEKDCDVQPVSNPEEVSDAEKAMKAEALMQFLGKGVYNDEVIKRRFLEALDISDTEELMEVGEAPPDPKIVLEQQKLQLEGQKFQLDLVKSHYEMVKLQADTIKSLAEAEAKEAGPQLEIYKAQMTALTTQMSNMNKPTEEGTKNE